MIGDVPPAAPQVRTRLWVRLLPWLAIAGVLAALWATGVTDYLSLESLRANERKLEAYRNAHPVLALLAYIGVYVLVVVFSVPGALFMTLAGGMLFGAAVGAAAAVVSATIGATVIFLVGRSTLGAALRARAGPTVGRLIDGFEKDAASYLLTLRLIPGVPFFAVNLAAGFVRVPVLTYVVITVIGIAPGSIIYASIGSTLVTVFARGETPNLAIIFEEQVLLPLLGLAALSLLPVIHRRLRARRA